MYLNNNQSLETLCNYEAMDDNNFFFVAIIISCSIDCPFNFVLYNERSMRSSINQHFHAVYMLKSL